MHDGREMMHFIFKTAFWLIGIILLILTAYLHDIRQAESRAYLVSFVSTRAGTREIYTMTAVGSNQHQLSGFNIAMFSYPEWDYGQNCILYIRLPNRYCIDLDGGYRQEYIGRETPASPLLTKIGTINSSTLTSQYSWFVVGTDQGLFRVSPDGSELRQLTATPAQTVYYVADSSYILFESQNGWSVISLDGQEEQYIAQQDFRIYLAQISPDGQWLNLPLQANAYPERMLLYNLRTGKTIYMGAYPYQFRWTSDGQYLIYPRDNQVYIYDVSNTIDRPVMTMQSGYGGFAFYGTSPDNQQLLMKVNENLYVMRPDGTDIVNITANSQLSKQVKDSQNRIYNRNNLNARWSPDGEWIVFQSELQYGTSDIYVVRPDGSDLHQLTSDLNWDITPSWLPPFEKSWHPEAFVVSALGLLSVALLAVLFRKKTPAYQRSLASERLKEWDG